MKKAKLCIIIITLIMGVSKLKAQDDLLSMLQENETDEGEDFTTATFKSTRLINGHTVETRSKGVLEFVIGHRFGRINQGIDDLFGLDQANIRFALEYGFTDNLNIGFGRSSFQKVYDGFIKYRILRQSNLFPFTMTGFASMTIRTLDFPQELKFKDRHSYGYSYQILLARKFSQIFSLQIMPSLVHRNFVEDEDAENDVLSLGVGGRFKLTKRVALNAEYYYQVTDKPDDIINALAFGFDIETGGHVFQLHLTNARTMNERGFITENTGEFFDGDIHFGFNVSRVFFLGGKKE